MAHKLVLKKVTPESVGRPWETQHLFLAAGMRRNLNIFQLALL